MYQHLTVARIAEGLSVSWNTANDAVLGEGRRVLIDDPHRFDGVALEWCYDYYNPTRRYPSAVMMLPIDNEASVVLKAEAAWRRPPLLRESSSTLLRPMAGQPHQTRPCRFMAFEKGGTPGPRLD